MGAEGEEAFQCFVSNLRLIGKKILSSFIDFFHHNSSASSFSLVTQVTLMLLLTYLLSTWVCFKYTTQESDLRLTSVFCLGISVAFFFNVFLDQFQLMLGSKTLSQLVF